MCVYLIFSVFLCNFCLSPLLFFKVHVADISVIISHREKILYDFCIIYYTSLSCTVIAHFVVVLFSLFIFVASFNAL